MTGEYMGNYGKDIPMRDKFEDLKTVLSNIEKGKKILIIGDNDGDGVPASAIFAKILKKFGFEYKVDFNVFFAGHSFAYDLDQDKQKQDFFKKYDYFFFLDTSFDLSFLQNKFVCVLDHHKVNIKPDLLINPIYHKDTKDKLNCCACALSYGAYRYFFGKNKILERIAFASCVSDWFPIGSLPYLGISKEDPEYFVNGDYIIPTIQKLNPIYYLLNIPKYNATWAFERVFFETDTDLKSIVHLPVDFYQKLYKQDLIFVKERKNIFDNLQKYDGFVFLTLDSKYRKFKTKINQDLQAIYSDITSFVGFRDYEEDGYAFSCRSQNYDLVKLINFMKQTCKTLKGGGHPAAAGLFVKTAEFDLYKQLIIENIKNFKN